MMKIDNPAVLLEQFSRQSIGNPWTIQELTQKVDNNKVEGVCTIDITASWISRIIINTF